MHDTQSVHISLKQDEHNVYVIMKTMCPSSYHHNGFVATHALGHMMYGYTLLVPMKQRVLKSHRSKISIIYNNIYNKYIIYMYIVYIYIYIYIQFPASNFMVEENRVI